MTLSALDIAMPIGLGIVFGAFRFAAYRRALLEDAAPRAALDALKGTAGIAVITFAYKYFTHT